MVLINNLTVDEINAALLHLQRSQSEVVGGEKGTTIQNITITNQGGGSGNSGGTVSQDWSPIIDALESRINATEKATLELDKKAAETEQIDNSQTEQISGIMEQLMSLSSNGITSLQFDATNRYLIIYTEDGNTYDVQITSEPITMSFDSTTNKLTLVMGNQTQEVTLPYINANQKGVAGGVATLDENGRVPYSQLPESAMEFKGEWDASTNTPTLADGVGTNGDFYICNVGGTVNFGTQAEPREVTFIPNDRVIYNGDSDLWIKLPAGQVVSVNGQSGVVELTSDDIPYDSSAQSPSVKDMLDDLQPVDNVTSGVMSPVTSNAVAQAIAGGGGTDIAVYPTLAAAEADLPNLNVGDFIATEQGGDGVTDAITSGDLRAVTSNAVAQAIQEFRSVYTIKVSYQNSKTIPFGNWGFGLCMGNIDGAGNFAFYFARSGANSVAISNLSSLGSGFFNATLNGNVVTIGTTNYKITITFNSDYTVTISWAGTSQSNLYGRMTFISGNSIF